jgi:hypothetical protein
MRKPLFVLTGILLGGAFLIRVGKFVACSNRTGCEAMCRRHQELLRLIKVMETVKRDPVWASRLNSQNVKPQPDLRQPSRALMPADQFARTVLYWPTADMGCCIAGSALML